MTRERWIALTSDDSLSLTKDEVADGWHFCYEFDGLLRQPVDKVEDGVPQTFGSATSEFDGAVVKMLKGQEFKCTCMDNIYGDECHLCHEWTPSSKLTLQNDFFYCEKCKG